MGINTEKIGFQLSLWALEPTPQVSPNSRLTGQIVALFLWHLVASALSWGYVFMFFILEGKKRLDLAQLPLEVRESKWKLGNIVLDPDQAALEFSKTKIKDPTAREQYYYEIKKHITELAKVRAG
jgi:hypothetical protein